MQNRVRAIIIENNKLLTIKRIKKDETYWVLPGGGIEEDENEKKALERECKEELGVEVRVGELVFEDDFYWKDILEKVYFYKCEISKGQLGTGMGPEYEEDSKYEGSFDLEWLDIEKLEDYDLRPIELKLKLLNEN